MAQKLKAIWKGEEYDIGYINFVTNRIQIAYVRGGVCYMAKELSLNSVKLEFGEPNY
jgi:hypothetical protein